MFKLLSVSLAAAGCIFMLSGCAHHKGAHGCKAKQAHAEGTDHKCDAEKCKIKGECPYQKEAATDHKCDPEKCKVEGACPHHKETSVAPPTSTPTSTESPTETAPATDAVIAETSATKS